MNKFIVLILVLICAGCSKLSIGLKIAPTYVTNKIDDAFDFDSDRFNSVRLQIQNDLLLNKTELLKLFIKQIDSTLALSEKKDITPLDFKNYIEDLQKLQKTNVQLFKSSFTLIIKNISQKEFENLNSYSQKKFDEADKLILDKTAFYEKQTDSFKNIFEFFFDSATKEQIQKYTLFLDENYDYLLYQIKVRRNFMANFKLKLADKDDLLDFTLKYYSGDSSLRTEEHQKKQLAFLEKSYQFQFELWKSTSDKQKAYFKKTLLSLKEELLAIDK